MSIINKAAVLNPFNELTSNILNYIPRATPTEFGIVAIGSGINVDILGRIYLDTQEYSDRLTAIEAQAASTLATQKSEVAAAITQANLTQSQAITALTLEVSNLKTNLTNSITATQTELITRADQLTQNVADIAVQLTQDKATFTQDIQDALDFLKDDASVASALRTPRKINGTDFDGRSDITTNAWGATRTFKIGNKTNSINGTSNIVYSLADIGAFPEVGGTIQGNVEVTGNLSVGGIISATLEGNAGTATKLQTPRTINGVSFDGSANITLPLASASVSGTVQLNNTLTSSNTGDALTAAQGKVLNDSKLAKTENAISATKLQTSRTISLSGGVTGSVSFDGSAHASIATTVTGLGTANGIATLDSNGQVPSTQLPSYVDDVLEYSSVEAFPTNGVAGKIYVETTGNTTYRWGGSAYVKITSGEVSSVAGKVGVVNLSKADVGLANADNTADSVKNVATAAALQTPRVISITGEASGSSNFDGSANASINLTLNDVNNSAGTYGANQLEIPTFTLNKKGLLTSAGNRAFPYAGIGQYGAAILYDGLDSYSTSHAATTNIVRHLNAVKVDINKSFNDAFGSDVDNYINAGNLKGFTSCADFPVGSRMIVDIPALPDMPNLGSTAVYFETKRTYTQPGKLQIAYGYNNGRTATRSASTGAAYSDWVYTADTSSISRYKQDLDATRVYSPNLSKTIVITDTNVQVPDLMVSGRLFVNGFASDHPYGFLTTSGQEQVVMTGGLLASNSYADRDKVHGLGIYAKGVIESVAGFKGKLLAADSRIFKPFNAEKVGISAYFVTEGGLNSDYAGANYGDFLSLNTYGDASAGNQNGLFFDKTGKSIVHYQSAFGAANWGSGKTLAYAEDVLSINGGTLTGPLTTNNPITVNIGNQVGAFQKLIQGLSSTDGGYIAVGNHGEDKGYLELGTVDDPDAAIYARKRNTANAVLEEAVILGSDGNTSFPKSVFIHNVPSGYGTCGLVAGNADNAAYAGCNIDITSWSGVGIKASNSGERTVVFNARNGDISTKGSINTVGVVNGSGLGVTGADGLGNGLSLYNGAMNGMPTYGIAFAQTQHHGGHGYVDGDWATYFTIEGAYNRGWIFKSHTHGNVASISSQGNAYFNGSIIAAGNITAYSDIRIKDNIDVIDDALNKVSKLKGVTFNRTDMDDKDKRYVGLIAQDVQSVMPEAVNISNDEINTLSVDYQGLVGLLVESIKELKLEIDELKGKVK